jgi:copper(I)-binding protein
MLFGLKEPLKSGDKFPLTLRFEKAGEVTVTVNVEAAGADHSMHH